MDESFVDANAQDEQSAQTEGFVTEVQAEQINFGPGLAVVATAGQDMSISKGGAFITAAGRDAEVSKGYVQVMAVGHDVDIDKGGAQVMVVGHDMQINTGGALVSLSQSFTGNNSFVGLVLSPKVELGEGTRVLLNTQQALIFGAAAGLVMGVLRLLFGKK